jgi:hypothetical protein
LNIKCKRYKENKKTEKKREGKEKNMKKGQGHRFGPAKKQAHGPLTYFPNRYRILPFSG